MNVLHRQAWICLVEPNRLAVRRRSEINEFLEMLSAWGRRRVLGELEDKIEDLADILGEIRDVGVEAAIVDGKEADLVVLKRHELCKMRRADTIQVFGCPAPSRAEQQLYLDEGKV